MYANSDKISVKIYKSCSPWSMNVMHLHRKPKTQRLRPEGYRAATFKK